MIKSFFKLIRWPNLLIVLASMFFMLFLVIRPVLGTAGSHFGMSTFMFVLLALATVFIAISGYIINDIKDQETDAVNRNMKNPVGTIFSQRQAAWLYVIFTFLGLAAGSYLAFLVQKFQYALIFLLTAGLLWYYSERYQCQPITGNIVVAFLSALSFGLVWLFEIFAMQLHPYALPILPENLKLANKIVFIYMGFAFLVSLLREIVKDIEDYNGDEKTGCLTFAVAYGLKKAKILALVVNLAGLAGVMILQWFFYTNAFMMLFWFFMLVDVIFISVGIKLLRADNKTDFSHLSLWIKTLMLTGILSMGLFYFK